MHGFHISKSLLTPTPDRKHYGCDIFDLIAHDRGARVAHRLCIDHPSAVRNLMLLDIAPTVHMFESTDQEFATKYWYVSSGQFVKEVWLNALRALQALVLSGTYLESLTGKLMLLMC